MKTREDSVKAFLLAAGRGTRLKPYTDDIPKCLMPIHGEPLMNIWIDLLAEHGVREVLVNTHHHARKVEAFIDGIRSQVPLTIRLRHEACLLGSAGTLWRNRSFVSGEKDFIVAYADNLTNVNLTEMVACHRRHRSAGAVLTVGLFRSPDPGSCGIAVLDKQNRITEFTEKPRMPVGNLANGGVYVASSSLFDFFPESPAPKRPHGALDLGFHVLPKLVGRMFGYEIDTYLRDIGTTESYEAAMQEWPRKQPHRQSRHTHT